MTTYLIAALAIIGPAVGFIAGSLFARGRLRALLEECLSLNDRFIEQNRRLAQRNRDYAEAELRRGAQRVAAAAKGRASQTAKRNAERAIRMEAAEQRLAMKEAAE